ncbi:patatin-like phospholipase family protein [Acinetobacter sp. ANC 4635]|uniref:patatin-like phospholipase family protein n=1 Tax=Acinetobacter sp. ANC 4635 TaxID=2529846 RepID=UPI0010397212|nr:patatin-like phospholipase family protein [Acinetobacter sp. ANC 4635]TCB32729.1 patatin-like phospholipase family protein [Acinetobacter sp. ANC 4635]
MLPMKHWIVTMTCLGALVGCQSIPHHETQAATLPMVATTAIVDEEAQSRPNLINFEQIKQQQHRPIVALVLGSGGARGYAHIGAIQVLEEHGIHPDFIVGTSAGSIVGALYASGKSPEQIKDIALNMKVQDVREITLRKNGFLDGSKVEDFINDQIGNLPLEKMRIPLFVVATELKEGKKVVFNYGNTGQAVRASSSIPSMFIPTKIQNKEYVDGGLVSPVPVDVARQLGADIVIAVDILAQPQYTETTNMWGLFNQNINIMQQQLSRVELSHADVIIQPDLREKAHIFDVTERDRTRLAGVYATQAKLEDIQQVIHDKEEQLLVAARS